MLIIPTLIGDVLVIPRVGIRSSVQEKLYNVHLLLLHSLVDQKVDDVAICSHAVDGLRRSRVGIRSRVEKALEELWLLHAQLHTQLERCRLGATAPPIRGAAPGVDIRSGIEQELYHVYPRVRCIFATCKLQCFMNRSSLLVGPPHAVITFDIGRTCPGFDEYLCSSNVCTHCCFDQSHIELLLRTFLPHLRSGELVDSSWCAESREDFFESRSSLQDVGSRTHELYLMSWQQSYGCGHLLANFLTLPRGVGSCEGRQNVASQREHINCELFLLWPPRLRSFLLLIVIGGQGRLNRGCSGLDIGAWLAPGSSNSPPRASPPGLSSRRCWLECLSS
mmetsp:Transcript_27295/g.62864  ORF Transcript_27295/g.62864 Transcript_27295/m.62864 type:complete len:335 (+) Transcript_27295:641-1645(+)